MSAVQDLKVTHRTVWAAGDYAAIARLIDDAPPRDVLAHAALQPGDRVLDVAAGTGNVAVAAAAAGARVTGLDLTPELLAIADTRAFAAGLSVEWVEGDAEALPFDDAAFDVVVSAFGVQFAPRHEVVARELARVTRPGGHLVLVNWTPGSVIGEVLRTVGAFLPAPPAFASPPPLWGNEQHVRRLFAGTSVELGFAHATNPFRFASAEEFVAFFEVSYGPMVTARRRLTETGEWDECRAQLVALAERRNAAREGGLLLEAEYLITVGRA